MNDALQNETVKNVNQIFTHPDFNPTILDNDVAILNIQPFKWSSDVEMLTAIDKPSDATECLVIGWGKSPNSEPFLQKIQVSIEEDGSCTKLYNYDTTNKMCVLGQNFSCLEEPGSGLVCDGELTGILSFGNTCNQKGEKQMVYTDITKYNVWIDEVFRTVITKKNEEQSTVSIQTTGTTEKTIFIPTTRATTSTTLRLQIYTSALESASYVPQTPEATTGHW